MWRTLIYYKPEQIDLAKKLRDDYIAHQKETDVIFQMCIINNFEFY